MAMSSKIEQASDIFHNELSINHKYYTPMQIEVLSLLVSLQNVLYRHSRALDFILLDNRKVAGASKQVCSKLGTILFFAAYFITLLMDIALYVF